MDREDEDKTSSVHFMRFELSDEMVAAAKGGAAINMGVDHENLSVSVSPVSEETRQSLVGDLQ